MADADALPHTRAMKIQFTIAAIAAALTLSSAERFDHLVRGDYFAGFAGNTEALERGMKASEEALKENPKHAEALVWHGAGLFFLAGQAFQKKDTAKGMELFGKGMGEMKTAVELEPNSIGVRVPRAAVLSSAARNMQGDLAKQLFESVIEDYTTVYRLQEKRIDQMGVHPKGELLFGLADAYSRTGAPDKAEIYFNLLKEKLPNTPYAKRADKWLETREPLPVAQTACIGCHTGK